MLLDSFRTEQVALAGQACPSDPWPCGELLPIPHVFSCVTPHIMCGLQVAERIRTDPRVTVLERTNLRYLTLDKMPAQQRVDLITLDLSFISILKVLPAVETLLQPNGALVALVKPQFEARKEQVCQTCGCGHA